MSFGGGEHDVHGAEESFGAEVDVEKRHREVLGLDPAAPGAVELFMRLLADPSWRVRKACLGRVRDFCRDEKRRERLTQHLIEGLAAADNVGLRNISAEALLRVGGSAVGPLAVALREPNNNLRKFVAEVVGSIGTSQARQVLLEALDDDDENVRTASFEALGRIGGSEVIGRLRELLASPKMDERLQDSAYLLEALDRAGAYIPYEELQPLLARRALQASLAPLLGRCGDPKAVTSLVTMTSAGSRGVRYAAVRALAQLADMLGDEFVQALGEGNDEGLRERVMKVAEGEDDASSWAGLRVLARLGGPAMIGDILGISSSRAFVHHSVQLVLSINGDIVQPLVDGLLAMTADGRVLAFEVLEQVNDSRAIEACVDILKGGSDTRSMEAAIRVLGRRGGPDEVDILVQTVERGDPDLYDQSALALAAVGRRHRDVVALRVLQAVNAFGIDLPWLYVLGAIGRDEDLQVVTQAFGHRDADVRRAAIAAAMEFPQGTGAESFLFALADESPMVRAQAARALGRFPGETARNALRRAVQDKDPWVVSKALMALASLGGEGAGETLVASCGHSDSGVAIAALQGCYLLNPDNVAQGVRAGAEHSDSEVVCEAIKLTQRLGTHDATNVLASLLAHESWDVRHNAIEAVSARRLQVPTGVLAERMDVERHPMVRPALEELAQRQGVA